MPRSALAATVAATALLILASSPLPVSAQGRWNSGNARERLPSARTPYGLCRVWINGLSRARQPAVTGCAYAYSNVPRNGRVIYGGERGQLFAHRSSPYFYDRRGSERDYHDDDYRDRDHYDRGYRNRDHRDRDYRDGDYRDRDYRDGDYRDRDYRDRDYRDRDYRDGDEHGGGDGWRTHGEHQGEHDHRYNQQDDRGHGRWK